MTEWMDSLREHFEVEESDGTISLRVESLSSGYVRWSAQVDAEHAHFSFTVLAEDAVTARCCTGTFMRALVALVEEHHDLALTVAEDTDVPRFELAIAPGEVGEAVVRLEQTHDSLAVVFGEITRGKEPFTALGERDAALSSGDAGGVETPAGSSSRTSSESKTPSSEAPPSEAPPSKARNDESALEGAAGARTSPRGGGVEWTAKSAEPGKGARAAAWALGAWEQEAGDTNVVVVLGMNTLPTGASTTDLALALRSTLARRFGLQLELDRQGADAIEAGGEAPGNAHFGGLEHVARLRGTTTRDVDRLSEQVEHFLQNLTEFVRGGLGLAEVLQFQRPSSRLVPEEGQRDGLDTSRETSRGPREQPQSTTTGDAAFDVYLQHIGYSDSRMRQMLGVLLSVDVIQAQELIRRLPALIVSHVSSARAEEVARLIRQTGGKAEICPAGQEPSKK